MGYRIAVVGATGNVGREMLNILDERAFPVDEIAVLASRRSLGTEVTFGEKTLTTQDLDTFDFTGWDMALFAVGSEATKKYAPIAAKAGCVVIDNSSLYRYDPDVPLIVPGIDELWDQTKSIYNPTDDKPAKQFTKQIAFNVIPHIDVFMDSGETKEEWKMVAETKKIVDPAIKVTATCVRVPVFVGHSEAVNIEFEEFLDEDEARDILREAPGIMVIDKREDGGYVTPVECVGDFATFISRIRQDSTIENGLNLWCVSDNLRKGAALNAVQIAEVLGRECLKKG